ncbi:hypothetical protein M1N15_01880 [Dehalococcoidia bacterium]|nr:hypothetical protein [Dehalococcoidia bacterium]
MIVVTKSLFSKNSRIGQDFASNPLASSRGINIINPLAERVKEIREESRDLGEFLGRMSRINEPGELESSDL